MMIKNIPFKPQVRYMVVPNEPIESSDDRTTECNILFYIYG